MSKNSESRFDEVAVESNEENEGNFEDEEIRCLENHDVEDLLFVKEGDKENCHIEEINKNTDIEKENGNTDTEEEVSQNISKQDSMLDLTDMLPFDELLILFSWLPLDDLITMRRVCHSWRVAAQDKSLWRNRVLHLYYGDEFGSKIKLMPNIQNIKSWDEVSRTLLDAILENINKLKRLDVEFHPPISSSHVRLILEKYPEIESITVGACDPDILECLEMLKRSHYLKEVKFGVACACKNYCPYRLSDVINVFTGSENFPALTALSLPKTIHFQRAMNNAYFRDVISNVIRSRSHQLSLLNIGFDVRESPEILNAIFQCIKLQTLYLHVRRITGSLNFQKMAQLRTLHLTAFEMNLNFFTTLQDSFYNGFWSHLTNVDIDVGIIVNVGLLRAVIDNAKSLESLKYSQTTLQYCITSDQLENINTLSKLKLLHVSGIKNITETCIYYISKCRSLKHLWLFSSQLDIGFNSYCIKNMLLELNNLQGLYIKGSKGSNLHFSNRQDIKIHIDSFP